MYAQRTPPRPPRVTPRAGRQAWRQTHDRRMRFPPPGGSSAMRPRPRCPARPAHEISTSRWLAGDARMSSRAAPAKLVYPCTTSFAAHIAPRRIPALAWLASRLGCRPVLRRGTSNTHSGRRGPRDSPSQCVPHRRSTSPSSGGSPQTALACRRPWEHPAPRTGPGRTQTYPSYLMQP